MRAYSDANKEAARVYVYTSLDRDADQQSLVRNSVWVVPSDVHKSGAGDRWINPELLAVGESKVNSYIEQEPRLGDFEFHFRDVFRQAPHTLSQDVRESLPRRVWLCPLRNKFAKTMQTPTFLGPPLF